MKNILIKAENISPLSNSDVVYPSLSLNICESSITSIIGPGSIEKTLWLKTLNGLNAMARGELALLQKNVRQLDRQTWLELKKEVSFVGKDAALLSAYTLMENIMLPALYHKLADRDEISRQAHLLLDEIGFEDREMLNQLPAYASHLQNYYASIVRALIVKPQLLFLDDLYTHLSLDKVMGLKQFLRHKVDTTGLSIVLATRNIKQVVAESTNIIFVSSSTTALYKSKQDLLKSDDILIKEYLSRYEIH